MDCCMIYANVSTAVGGEKKLAPLCLLACLFLITTNANAHTHTHTHTHTHSESVPRITKLKPKLKDTTSKIYGNSFSP